MQVRHNHEDPGPSPSLVSSRPQVGTTSSDLPHPQPATGKAKGRAMVLRRNRARRVLLRTGDDHAPGARRPVESCNFLPWRSNHGAAERLDKLFPQILLDLLLQLNRPPRFTVGTLSRTTKPTSAWANKVGFDKCVLVGVRSLWERALLCLIRSNDPEQAGSIGTCAGYGVLLRHTKAARSLTVATLPEAKQG